MPQGWRLIVAIVGPLLLGALAGWAWIAIPLPPAGPDHNAVALTAVGAIIAVSAIPLWEWGKRATASFEDTDIPSHAGTQVQVRTAKNSTVAGSNVASPAIKARRVTYTYNARVPDEPQKQSGSEGASDTQASPAGPAPPPIRPTTQHNLPPRNPKFTGRDTALAEVERALAGGPVAVVAVRGLGGIGKSQLALEYAHRIAANASCSLVWWVRADSPVSLVNDLAALAPVLDLHAPADTPPGDLVPIVLAQLRARSDWLVVFDNAENPDTLRAVLPGGSGQRLITSRYRAWSGLAEQIDLDPFDRAESVNYLTERTRRTEPDAADALAAELGDLPLALAQAAAYIDSHGIGIAQYVTVYREHASAKILREAGLEQGEYPHSVAATWLLHLRDLERDEPAGLDVLRFCAFLEPDEIDLDVLFTHPQTLPTALRRAWADPLRRIETIGALAATGLIAPLDTFRIRVHRLVQAVTRDQLDSAGIAKWTRIVVQVLAGAFPPEPWHYDTWPTCAALAPHVQSAVDHAAPFTDLAPYSAALLASMGSYFRATARLDQAHTSLQRGLAIFEAAYGADHHFVARTLTNLGLVQHALGDVDRALISQRRALEIKQAAYGPDHPEVAITLTNLGIVQRALGELDQAGASLRRALEIKQAAYGPDHPEVATTLANLGLVQHALGELDRALVSQRRALEIRQYIYGPDHPDVATALNNLGLLYRDLGDLNHARASLQRALSIFEATYGPDHPHTAKARLSLAKLATSETSRRGRRR